MSERPSRLITQTERAKQYSEELSKKHKKQAEARPRKSQLNNSLNLDNMSNQEEQQLQRQQKLLEQQGQQQQFQI